MPAVQPGSLILVTGASGYIAAWTVKQLLDRGHRVRGTVRSEAKGQYLKDLFKNPNFSYVIAEDVEKKGVFDEAVKDVDGIAHIASPFHFKVEDPHKDLINPAVNGTRGILESASKYGKNVKRVVITSSFASILTPVNPPHTFTEEEWNTHSPKEVETKGKDASPADAYRASKTLAEKAAWEFVESNSQHVPSETVKFDLATINPPLVLGPLIHQVSSPDSLNTSVSQFYKYLTGQSSADGATAQAGNMVDVRDVANAHIQALLTSDAGGQRFAITAVPYSWQQALDVLHGIKKTSQKDELFAVFPKIPVGKPGEGTDNGLVLSNEKSKKVLHIDYKSFSDTILEMAFDLAEKEKKGWKY